MELVFPTAWVTVSPTGGNCLDINQIFTAEDRAEKKLTSIPVGIPVGTKIQATFVPSGKRQNSY